MTITRPCITFLPMVEKTNTQHEFAARLRTELERQKLSVKDLSQACDVTYEMARRYTRGTAKPRGDKIVKIAEWLGVSPSWLEYGPVTVVEGNPVTDIDKMVALSGERAEHPIPSGLTRYDIEDFSGLSDDEKRLLVAFRQLPYIEARNMLLSFEARSRQLKEFYSKK